MSRQFAAAVAVSLCAAPFAADAACPRNPVKPTTVDGVRVKPGSCGPYMMKVREGLTADGYYGCTDVKGKALKALYNQCKQTNAAKPRPGR